MKNTLAAEKTAPVHRIFGASNYVNRADKDKKFTGNSSIFKWKKPQDIQLKDRPNIMDIESTTYDLEVFHWDG